MSLFLFTVLDEIISVLVSPQLITEITKPQQAYTQDEVKNIIEDIAQCSAMRLDPCSMNKLWDLITMVFKWQITLCTDLVKLTQRHLYEIENYVTQPETQLQLHRVQNLIDNFAKTLSTNELNQLREDILDWHKSFNVRVSLLLRLGLQSNDGTFIANNDPICQEILRNLGENIYAVTENGKILEKNDDNDNSKSESQEMKLFVDEIRGDNRKNSSTENENILKLTINRDSNRDKDDNENKQIFDNISIDTGDNKLSNIMNDLNLNDTLDTTNFKEDLIDMIGKDT